MRKIEDRLIPIIARCSLPVDNTNAFGLCAYTHDIRVNFHKSIPIRLTYMAYVAFINTYIIILDGANSIRKIDGLEVKPETFLIKLRRENTQH